MNKPYEPGEILPEEINRSRILVKGRNGMDTNCATAKGIVATGAASNRNAPNRASADREPTDSGSAYRKNNSEGRSAKRKETDREPAKGKEPARQASKGKPASSHIT